MSKTSKISGITIRRSGTVFTAEWKQPAVMKKQQVRWRFWLGCDPWTDQEATICTPFVEKDINASRTSWDLNIWEWVSSFYPGSHSKNPLTNLGMKQKTFINNEDPTLRWVGIQVRVKESGKSWSDWKGTKYDVIEPRMNSITTNWDENAADSCSFSYEAENDTSSNRWFTELHRQTAWQEEGAGIPWQDLGYISNSSGTSDVYSTSRYNPDKSYIRWYRVRAVGPQGGSGWFTEKHVFGMPYQPSFVVSPYIRSYTRNIINGYTSFKTPFNDFHPIDTGGVMLQYIFANPAVKSTGRGVNTESYQLTTPEISGSWNTIAKFNAQSDIKPYPFNIDTTVPRDQIMYLRLIAKHDTEATWNYSEPVMVTEQKIGCYYLSDPSGLSVEVVDDGEIRVQVTNNSSIPESRILVHYKTNVEDITVGVLPNKVPSGGSFVKIPGGIEEDFSIGVSAFLGSLEIKPSDDGSYNYIYKKTTLMESKNTIWIDGEIAKPPVNIVLTSNADDTSVPEKTIKVGWTWTWPVAQYAELSWSDEKTAWESTNEPTNYRIDKLKPSQWYIAGIETGTSYYVRVRLIYQGGGDSEIIGPWSAINEKQGMIDMATAPVTPTLWVVGSKYKISLDTAVVMSWTYVSNDDIPQKYAQILYYDEETSTVGEEVAYVSDSSSQSIVLDPRALNWETGKKYTLVSRVESESEKMSDYSTPITIEVVDPISITFDDDVQNGVTLEYDDIIDGSIRNANPSSLGWRELDLTNDDLADFMLTDPSNAEILSWLSLNGASTDMTVSSSDTVVIFGKKYLKRGGYGTHVNPYVYSIVETPYKREYTLTTLPVNIGTTYYNVSDEITRVFTIRRKGSYEINRPDESKTDGFDQEIVYSFKDFGESMLSLSEDSIGLYGSLDDGAEYTMTVTIYDDYGQVASDSRDFIVRWDHQAIEPDDISVDVSIDEEDEIVKFELEKPEDFEDGDYFQIYRMSSDKPELIVDKGEYDTVYVDPYPTIGDYGGHRIVCKTKYGDYISPTNKYAWVDLGKEEGDYYKVVDQIINFDSERVDIRYNVELSSNWKKEFKETKYLGGSVQGDWNPAISRSGSVSTIVVGFEDPERIKQMRRLAAYPGICHIRTTDGSNYAADIQVSETRSYENENMYKYSLTITKVDSERLDGMTLDEWEGTIPVVPEDTGERQILNSDGMYILDNDGKQISMNSY